jgi:hypothetical protein
MPLGIPGPPSASGGSNELSAVQGELAEARARLKQYEAWINGQGALQRLKRANPAHPILILRNSVVIVTLMSMFGLVTSVVLPLVDGSYSRQMAALDSATGLSLTSAFLAIGLLTLAIWVMLGFAATSIAQDLPQSPEAAAGLQRIRHQIQTLEKQEQAISSGDPAAFSRLSGDGRLDLGLGKPAPSRSETIKRDILRLADDLAVQQRNAQIDENERRLRTGTPAPTRKRSLTPGRTNQSTSSNPAPSEPEDTTEEPTAPNSDPGLDDGKLAPFGDFISDDDLDVEVTADPSGAWDPTLPSSTGTAGIYRYTEILDDLEDDLDFGPDPETEELEDLWRHLAEPWLRNTMAKAERLADRLPNQAHLEVSNAEHTPFTLVIEGTSPGLTMRTVVHFVDFLAEIPTPPNAAIELIRIAHLSRDFHKNVKAALEPRFPNGIQVARTSNRIDITFNDAYSGWSNYPYLPVDE